MTWMYHMVHLHKNITLESIKPTVPNTVNLAWSKAIDKIIGQRMPDSHADHLWTYKLVVVGNV